MCLKTIFIFALAFSLLSFISCAQNTYDESLKSELENNYNQFIIALNSKEELIIKSVMSSYSYASNKNDYADAKEPFTERMKEIGQTYPLPQNLRFIKMFKKGPTAALLYSRDSESSKIFDRPMVTFMFIKFVKEAGLWKTEGVELIDIEKYEADGSLTVFDESFLPPENRLDGNVKEAPPLIQEAEVTGILEIFVKGIRAMVSVNGIRQGSTHEISDLRLIHGGLKYGNNTVEIISEDKDGPAEKFVDLSINAKRKDGLIEVFRYTTKKEIPKKYIANFIVPNDITH